MKNCSYCGKECADETVSCFGCGTPFAKLEEPSPGGLFRRPPRPEAASVVLKTFSQEAPAQQAVEALRAARIEAFVATDDCGGLYPPLNAGSPFRLLVSEVHREAAEQVLADTRVTDGAMAGYFAGEAPISSAESSKPAGPPSLSGPLLIFALGFVVGVLAVLGYQQTRERFSGTVERDYDRDGRTDGWDTYLKGQSTKSAVDLNGDERPDVWYYYADGVLTKWEEDFNFDGQIDVWGTYDRRGISRESKVDLDSDGQPDVTHYFQSGLVKESHYTLRGSELVWKKSFYTNGLLREEWLDRDRDEKFDEKFFFDIYGVEVKKEVVKP